ncbi:helix-turn-helix transcriptional regulator [Streptomyces sp. JJ66]|uniref:helix-turn-helix domain-containing protein n=1 Tax=Streptomyces sp. JJ66 TaxID=2803843 RepID=UPI001C595B0B|nr:helix-turn-helix transcriptional regulator [Streptomyces sp. JJ66]MBW1600986.1 helix-turn-helix transcriptional regulator [Streptomyces sp. JJ66]
MAQWAEYSTGERIKMLRGKSTTQASLAEMTGLSVVTIQKAEQDKKLTLPTLMKIAAALSVDTSVILGQQAPRRAMDQNIRAALRAVSGAVHDAALGFHPEHTEPVPLPQLAAATERAWDLYWSGQYVELGAILVPLLSEASVTAQQADGEDELHALKLLSDAYQIAACAANLLNSRDLAYAAGGYARAAALRGGDSLRAARVDSALAWVYMRDGRLAESLALSERAAASVEPSYSDHSAEQLTVYGNLVTHCAVTAARLEVEDRARDFLSTLHAVGARLGSEHNFHGARFGPVTATTQAVGVNATMQSAGKALALAKDLEDTQLGALADSARNRYRLDIAMAQADARMWDASLETLERTMLAAPEWSRHQALPGVIAQKVGRASTARLRRVMAMIDMPPIAGMGTLAPPTHKTSR